MHDGQSPLVLASERRVLDGDGFKIMVGDVDDEKGSSPKTVYARERTGANTTNLEVSIVVEVNEVGMSLSEFSKGGCSLKLLLESVLPLLSMVVESEVMSDSPGVSRRRVVIVVNEAAYGGQIISSLNSRDEVVDEGFGRRTGGFSFPNDRLLWWRSLFRGFLSELKQNGVVNISHWSRSSVRGSQR